MSTNDKQRILAIDTPPTPVNDFQVQALAAGEDAMALIRSGQFDSVLTNCNAFEAIERNLVQEQANLVLNTIGEGVLVVNQSGHCDWSNKRMQAYPPQAMEQVLQICSRAVEIFSTLGTQCYDNNTVPSKKFSFPVDQDQHFELIASPVIEPDKQITQVVAVVWDATRSKRMEQKINAIETAGRELAKLESERIAKLSPSQRLDLLRDKIIKTSKELLDFDHFNIRVVDERDKKLDIVIDEGLPPEALEIDLYAQPEGNGISGYVAATGRSYICHDTEKDPRYILGIKHCKSSLTVPLRLHDKIIGVFNVESDTVGVFQEDDRQFAEIFGQYVAM
ncbi:MAG: GAF domain-containing protein, partial [Phycisphaeraceae bacterium]|nr:GAF domain-containing protein [Phycisphaeraceae bacterium]